MADLVDLPAQPHRVCHLSNGTPSGPSRRAISRAQQDRHNSVASRSSKSASQPDSSVSLLPRTYKPARDDVRPSPRFSLFHHHPPLPPLLFSENARSEGICDPSWLHKRGRCRHHPARVHVPSHSPCDVDSAHHDSTYSTTSQHRLNISTPSR